MDTLQRMRIFSSVVDTGSFTAAARQFKTTAGFVSRAVAGLEAHLRARLLRRTTRLLELTEAGERYLHDCRRILAYVEQAEAEVVNGNARPVGRMRVHAMTCLGQQYVVPATGRYLAQHPAMQIELILGERVPDLRHEDYDVSLVTAPRSTDSGLVSELIGRTFAIVCASPDYLAARGEPRIPAELNQHVCLRFPLTSENSDVFVFDGPDGQEAIEVKHAKFRTNLVDAMVLAVQQGMGIGVLPFYSAMQGLRSGNLVRILPAFTSQPMDIYAVSSPARYLDPKVVTWMDFLHADIPERLANDRAALR